MLHAMVSVISGLFVAKGVIATLMAVFVAVRVNTVCIGRPTLRTRYVSYKFRFAHMSQVMGIFENEHHLMLFFSHQEAYVVLLFFEIVL